MDQLLNKSQLHIRIANWLLKSEWKETREEILMEQVAFHIQQGMERLIQYIFYKKGIPYTKNHELPELIPILEKTGFMVEDELKENVTTIMGWKEHYRDGDDFYVDRKETERTIRLYENLMNQVRRGADFKDTECKPESLQKEMVAYVDGSYNVKTGEFSYGMVAFIDGEEIHLSEKMDDANLAAMRNVAGEIKGAEAAMRFALDRGCKKLAIYYDYEGIAKWCLGEWKTNKEGTMAYKQFYNRIRNELEVEFIKVKGHSNDKYNDLADELAKKALSI